MSLLFTFLEKNRRFVQNFILDDGEYLELNEFLKYRWQFFSSMLNWTFNPKDFNDLLWLNTDGKSVSEYLVYQTKEKKYTSSIYGSLIKYHSKDNKYIMLLCDSEGNYSPSNYFWFILENSKYVK